MDYEIKGKERIELKRVDGAVLQVAYVLTSTDKDPYLEQMWLSVRSLRWHNPRTKVVAVTDRATYDALTPVRKEMLETVDEIIIVDLDPELSGKVRSRLLKTGLREIVKGDFLYIDTDTIIVDSLEQMDYLNQFELAAVRDLNLPWSNKIKRYVVTVSQKTHFDLNDLTEIYNGGVMWAMDTVHCHEFFKTWTRKYLEDLENGCSFDQPALSVADEIHRLIHPMSNEWNVLGAWGVKWYSIARLFHYNGDSFGLQPRYCLLDAEFLKKGVADFMGNLESEEKSVIVEIQKNVISGFRVDISLSETRFIPMGLMPLFWYMVHYPNSLLIKISTFFSKILARLR